MTHMEFIRNNFTVLAETANSIFFDAYGEKVAEINGYPFNCNSVEEFHELVEFWGDETFEEQPPPLTNWKKFNIIIKKGGVNNEKK